MQVKLSSGKANGNTSSQLLARPLRLLLERRACLLLGAAALEADVRVAVDTILKLPPVHNSTADVVRARTLRLQLVGDTDSTVL